MKVVAIIMTYNERENIGPMLEAWLKIARENPKYSFEVLVADGNSPDGTGEVVKKYGEEHDNIHLLSSQRLGMGKELINAYRYAMDKLGAEVVIPIDVDFQFDPFLAPKLLAKIGEGYDVIIASRKVPGGGSDFNWFRKLTNFVSDTLLAYYWAGIKEVKDHAGLFKAIRVRGVLDKIDLGNIDVVGFSVNMKTIYELSKVTDKFYEVPAFFGKRRAGQETTVGLKSMKWFIKYVFEAISQTTRIRLERSQRFFKFAVVGFIGYLINASTLYLFANVFKLAEWLSWGLSTEMAIISNFTLNNLWTFRVEKIKGVSNLFKKFLQFNGTSAGALLIQTVVGTLGTFFFGAQYRQLLLPFIIVFLVLPYNYFMYTNVIWRKAKK
ncbi:glycosyltransferase [Candidatus Shapirobacteria bacterium]|nr:glycosyltransferase [Candidatus Shapirobacteria bacterium]